MCSTGHCALLEKARSGCRLTRLTTGGPSQLSHFATFSMATRLKRYAGIRCDKRTGTVMKAILTNFRFPLDAGTDGTCR
jgi:hypothetical protein